MLRTPRIPEIIEADELYLEQLHQEFDERQTVKKKKSDKLATRAQAQYEMPKTVRKKYPGIKNPPVLEKDQNKLADRMLQWVYENPNETRLEVFPLNEYISPYKFFKLAISNSYFADALNIARREMGARLQANLQNNPIHQMKMLPLYHDELQEWELRKAKVDKNDGQTKVVVIDRFPDK